jgi:arginase
MKKIIVNANCDLGVNVSGSEKGPRELTKNIKNLNIINVNKKDYIKSNSKEDLEKNFDGVNDFNERLYKEIISHDEFVITLGGDHSISIASALASVHKYPGIGILWIDAHTDYNTFKSTITGNIHGLPLSTINGKNGTRLSYFHNSEYISDDKTVIIGARSIDPKEQEVLDQTNVTIYTTNDMYKKSILSIMQEAFKIAGSNNKIHISFDVDILDPLLAPGVSVPEIDGVNYKQVEEIFNFLLENKEKIASLDIVEYNPITDKNNKTFEFTEKLLKRIID